MPHKTIERRVLTVGNIRAKKSPKGLSLEGRAAPFNAYAQLNGFREKINPRAFDRPLAEKQDVRLLWNHDPSTPLARCANGSLRLSTDSRGLNFSADLPDTTAARDLHELIRSGIVSQCSFGFVIDDGGEKWTQEQDADGNAFACRELLGIKTLTDVSPVTYPAYDDTVVDARDVAVPAELRSAVDAKNTGKKNDVDVSEATARVEEIRARRRNLIFGGW